MRSMEEKTAFHVGAMSAIMSLRKGLENIPPAMITADFILNLINGGISMIVVSANEDGVNMQEIENVLATGRT